MSIEPPGARELLNDLGREGVDVARSVAERDEEDRLVGQRDIVGGEAALVSGVSDGAQVIRGLLDEPGPPQLRRRGGGPVGKGLDRARICDGGGPEEDCVAQRELVARELLDGTPYATVAGGGE